MIYKNNKILLAVLLTMNLLSGTTGGLLQMAIPLYALTLNINTVQLGLITGIGSLGRLLIILPSGFWVDRYGPQRLFYSCTMINAVLAMIYLFSASPYSLLVLMILQGMTSSISVISLQTIYLKLLTSLSLSQAGWQRGMNTMGFQLIGPLLGGYLIQVFRFSGTFIAISMIYLINACLSLYYQRKTTIRTTAGQISNLPLEQLQHFKGVLTNRLLLQVMVLEAVSSATFMIFRTFIAPLVSGLFHASVEVVTGLVLLQGIAVIIAVFAGGILLNLLAFDRYFIVTSILMVAGASLLASGTNLELLTLGTIIFGLGTGLLNLACFARLSMVEGEKGKIAALFSFSNCIGGILGPVLGGLIGGILTPRAVFWAPVAAYCFGGIWIALSKGRQKLPMLINENNTKP